MTASPGSRQGVFANWYWLWLTSAFFVGAMVLYFLMDHPAWYRASYRGISLSHEMSYAVWWSGICLFLAGIIFCRVAELAAVAGRAVWPWLVLALAMLALCLDEVGSLHEAVSRIAGWTGLLPFAIAFGIAFGLALLNLFRRRELRPVVMLIAFSLVIFISVAGLERVEHEFQGMHHFYRKLRLVAEEGSELVAMGLLITAGLIAMARMGDVDRRFHNATSAVGHLLDYPVTIFFLFVLQIMVNVALVVPNYTFFPEGIPTAVFPMLMFFCLGIIARQRARVSVEAVYWRTMAVILFVASALQMYNLNTLVNSVFEIHVNAMTGPPLSWLMTLVPLLALGWYAWRSGTLDGRDVVRPLLALFLVYLLIYPDLQYRYRIEYLYFIFSSAIAYTCYQFIGRVGR